MNYVFSNLINKDMIVYINDILIYSETKEEYTKLVMKVLELLRDASLCVLLKKSVFYTQSIKFLGYIIGVNRVKISKEVVRQILEWKTPEYIKDVQSFLGFVNFYQRF